MALWGKASLMAQLALLYRHLLSVCKNGVLPNLKLISALTNLHAAKAIYHTKDPIGTWAPDAGASIRMVSAQFREAASDERKQRVCLAKAHVLQNRLGTLL